MSFEYHRATSLTDAVQALRQPGARALGGGTDLLPQIREGLASPRTLVDLRALPGSSSIDWDHDGTVAIGASVRLTELARDVRLAADFPMLSQSCAAVGSHALRNMGTLGGNLCQRPRCWYFRHGFACHKNGGDSCPALAGENHQHAIFGGGPCVAVHPSDPAVALAALEATLHLAGPDGDREVAVADFFVLPDRRLDQETVLAPGEIITRIVIPGSSAGGVQRYDKVMQRDSWDFALVSLAACRRQDGDVRLVLGGVAPIPWRVTDSIEEDVASGGLGEDDIETLGERALYDARPLAHNAYKVELAGTLLRRAISWLGEA
ncbi:MAG: xanthine dehydrogenase family protein subunit M [Gemmatimonadaceae bacterium]